MSAQPSGHSLPDGVRGHPLLVVIDPAARSTDGESVRIAKDVLCAGAAAKICFPDGPEEYARALARRGHRRPVVIGDDRALLRAVALLHKERDLAGVALAVVPVGAPGAVALARALGVPTDTVAAARAVLDGTEHSLHLLTDDSDGIVLGGLDIPSGTEPEPSGRRSRRHRWKGLRGRPGQRLPVRRDGTETVPLPGPRTAAWWDRLVRTARTALSRPAAPPAGPSEPPGPYEPPGLTALPGGRRSGAAGHRLRVEADGVVLADLDRPVRWVSVTPGDGDDGTGLAEVVVHWQEAEPPVRARARAVTVSGADFRYRADVVVGGPVRTRTWTVHPDAWRLTLPHD
ncbi:diacylglycerol kinase [Streptomyces chrestomyceticus JCM 4735]|uniref:Diacylglycerol kinase n=1 Tax=Streptomyces chrestomyceticus JCM 4735 TaxID=1306181 RepID=A0A7U9KW95_9ACTN|nr:hypothetical protein [Streptomyces chrestomyceticus]GCD36570.1 diacylglycerol kinase [Streptomyces chrestomyceticus JCM 4735]